MTSVGHWRSSRRASGTRSTAPRRQESRARVLGNRRCWVLADTRGDDPPAEGPHEAERACAGHRTTDAQGSAHQEIVSGPGTARQYETGQDWEAPAICRASARSSGVLTLKNDRRAGSYGRRSESSTV